MTRILLLAALLLTGCSTTTPSREEQEMAWFIDYLNTASADTNK